jgi:hypothetical protein
MANEGTLRVRLADPIDFTVADGAAISKGAILELSDPRTAAANNGSGDVFAGIAARDKIANDGRTQLAAFTRGIFDLTVGAVGVTLGAFVSTEGANTIKDATEAEIAAGKAIGRALETGAAAEVVQVLVGGY